MWFFFGDDARQAQPTRRGMGPVIAIGGMAVPADRGRALERGVDQLCANFDLPPGEPCKWSLGRGLWIPSLVLTHLRARSRLRLIHVPGQLLLWCRDSV